MSYTSRCVEYLMDGLTEDEAMRKVAAERLGAAPDGAEHNAGRELDALVACDELRGASEATQAAPKETAFGCMECGAPTSDRLCARCYVRNKL